MRTRKIQLSLSTLLLTSLLAACGGGGGSSAPASTLSGTAATGAAFAGATITVKDSTGQTRTGTSGSNGGYSVSVKDLVPPFILQASKDGVALYAVALPADVDGTINITPLTSLIAGNALGSNPATAFASFDATTATTLTAQLGNAITAVRQITAALGQDVDPLRTGFSAGNHGGLDAVLDVLKVDFNGNTATLSDGLGNVLLNDDLTDTGDVNTAALAAINSQIENLKSAATELSDVSAGITSLLANMTQKCGNPAAVQNAPTQCSALFVSSDYLDEGKTDPMAYFDGWYGDGVTALTYTQPVILARLGENEYRIRYTLTGVDHGKSIPWWMETVVRKENDQWRFAGSQQYTWFDWHYQQYPHQYGEDINGWVLQLELKFQTQGAADALGVDHVVVTGPGLPDEGVTIAADNFVADSYSQYVGVVCIHETDPNLPYCPNSYNGATASGFAVQDAANKLVLNTPGLYRYRLYDSSGNEVGEGRNWLTINKESWDED